MYLTIIRGLHAYCRTIYLKMEQVHIKTEFAMEQDDIVDVDQATLSEPFEKQWALEEVVAELRALFVCLFYRITSFLCLCVYRR